MVDFDFEMYICNCSCFLLLDWTDSNPFAPIAILGVPHYYRLLTLSLHLLVMGLYPHNCFKITTLFDAVLQNYVNLGTGIRVNSVEDMFRYKDRESGENTPKQVIRYFFMFLLCFHILCITIIINYIV